MEHRPNAIKATLSYLDHVPFNFGKMERELSRVMTHAGLSMPITESVARVHATFIGEDMSLRVARDGINLVIWIEDGTSAHPAPTARRLAACYHAVRYISTLNELETIVWHHTGRSYTFDAFEAEIMADTSDPTQPTTPLADAGDLVEPPHTRSIMFEMAALDVDTMLDRLDRDAKHGMRASCDATMPQTKEPNVMVKDAPSDIRKIKPHGARHHAAHASIELTENRLFREALYPAGTPKFDADEDLHLFGPAHQDDVAEQKDVSARFAVYALNSVLLVAALPVGLGMAAYNVLGGENFRLTAQMVALTGLFHGVAVSTNAASLLGVM